MLAKEDPNTKRPASQQQPVWRYGSDQHYREWYFNTCVVSKRLTLMLAENFQKLPIAYVFSITEFCKFGVGCDYPCHCQNNGQCNVNDGSCSTGCDDGDLMEPGDFWYTGAWYGYGCQIGNILYTYCYWLYYDGSCSTGCDDGDLVEPGDYWYTGAWNEYGFQIGNWLYTQSVTVPWRQLFYRLWWRWSDGARGLLVRWCLGWVWLSFRLSIIYMLSVVVLTKKEKLSFKSAITKERKLRNK